MDKGWMNLPRFTPEYESGVDSFLDFAFQNSSLHDMILCPCIRCVNGVIRTRDEVKEHVIVWGFIKGYTYWIAHGELALPSRSSSNITEPWASVLNTPDNMEGLVHDAFGVRMDVDVIDATNGAGMQMPNAEAQKFYQLIDDSQQELYPGCRSFTSLSFTLRLLHLKCLGKWSNKHFTMLLDLLRQSYPEGVQLPKTYYEAEKVMKELGLGYDKIDACPNDCTLYWGEKTGWKSCPTCQHPRWVISDDDTSLGRHDIEQIHSETFAKWFTMHDLSGLEQDKVAEDLRFLAVGPNEIGIKYERFIVNGFRFHIKDVEQRKKTQNSGVTVSATTNSFSSRRDQNPISSEVDYYGILKSIIELEYRGGRRVVLFECDWVSSGSRLKKDGNGFLLANFTNVRPHCEPFILASQASQVFYVDDPTEKDWKVVITANARSAYKMHSTLDVETYLQSGIANPESDVEHEITSGLREGIQGVEVNVI